MLSYWERESLINYDYIIVGSGIVGLNVAINIRTAAPHARVAIIERGILPSGASTRNAGFACFGSVSELLDDAQTTSEDDIYDLYLRRKNGIHLLRSRLGDVAIGYKEEGSHELLKASESDVLDKVESMNRLLKDIDKRPAFTIANDIIQNSGFSNRQFKFAIAANLEGSIETGKMMDALITMCQKLGVRIITGAAVNSLVEAQNDVIVAVQDAIRNTEIPFTAKKVVVCTNAFAHHFFPNEDIQPGRGQVMVTKPIPNLKMHGIFHFDKGYYYFRAIHDRILIGGGRNLDFQGETTTIFGTNSIIENALLDLLKNDIAPNHKLEIDMQWSGIMAFGNTKLPIIHNSNDKIYGAFRLGGMGVALGTQLAEDVTKLLL